jgi:hypothetical protein
MGYFFMLDVLPPATTRHASQTAAQERPQLPRLKSEAQRNGEGQQGRCAAARLWAKLISRSAAEANQ